MWRPRRDPRRSDRPRAPRPASPVSGEASMTRQRIGSVIVLLALAAGHPCPRAYAQAGFDDDRVMLQGFYWESYRHGDPGHPEFGTKKWYAIVGENADELRDARFDLIWLPPPSFAGERSAGYN